MLVDLLPQGIMVPLRTDEDVAARLCKVVRSGKALWEHCSLK